MNKLYLFAIILSVFSVTKLQADTLTEGFEDVALTDAEGNPLANSWSYGYGLSNGWKVVGGSIYGYAGSTNYGLWTTAHTGGKSLEASYSASNAAFIAIPTKLTGSFSFWARKTSSSSSTKGYVNIWELEESEGTYTKKSTLLELSNLTTTWTQYTVDLGTSGKLVGINMIRAGIDDISAEIYEEAPSGTAILVYEDAEASKRVSTDIYDYGFQSTAADKTFYIKNDGAASRTYNFIVPAGYSADASLEVAAGQVEPFTVTQTYGEGDYGFKEGTLTVSSTDMDDVAISIKGIARDPEKIYLDFETEPEGWTVEEGWTINEGVATADYNNKSIFSPMVEVKEGDKLYLKYNFNSTYGELTIKYSTDNSAFTQVTKITPDQRDVWGDVVVDVPANAHFLAIQGKYVLIDDVYGLSLSQSAQMTIDVNPLAFGMINAEQTLTKEIGNIGTADLTNILATVDNANFQVSVETTTVAPEATTNIFVKALPNALGMQEGVVTVTADGQDDASFAVSAYVCDPEQMLADFNDNALPEGWTTDGWTFVNGEAFSGNDKYITTPMLSVGEGEQFAFMAKGSSWLKELSMEMSTDWGETWTEVKNFNDDLTDDYQLFLVDDIAPGNYMFRFKGYNIYVDAMAGYRLATIDHQLVFSQVDIPAEGRQYSEYTASATIREMAGKNEEFTASLYIDGVTVATQPGTVNAYESQELTFTYIPAEPVDNASAYIEVTYGETLPVDDSSAYTEAEIITTEVISLTILPAYTLDDAVANTVVAGKYDAVIVKYDGKEGWNTVVMPFNVTDLSVFGEGAKAYEYKGMDGQALAFDPVTELEAATAYVLYLPQDITEPLLFTDVEVPYYAQTPYTVTTDGATFVPVYAPIDAPDMQGKYGVVPETGRILRGTDTASLRAFRAYFDMPDASAPEYDVVFSDGGVPTAISSVSVLNDEPGVVYDLSGRKMNTGKALPSGVYVKNGKKYVVK